MDFDFGDFFKKQLPALLGQAGNYIMGSFSGMWGFIANALGLTDKLQEGLSSVSNSILERADPSLATIQKSLPAHAAAPEVYQPIATALGLPASGEPLDGVKTILTETAKSFAASGIPELKNGRPVEAVIASRNAYAKIYNHLAGGDDELGALLLHNPNLTPEQRHDMASRIASYLTGVTADASAALALNVPNNGLVSLLAKVQTEKDIAESALSLSMNATVLSAQPTGTANAQAAADEIAANTQTPVSGGTDVACNTAPPCVGSKTQSALVIH